MSKDESYRVYRGGCWSCAPAWARVAYRGGSGPSGRSPYLGFRLARMVSPLERLADAGKELNREKG